MDDALDRVPVIDPWISGARERVHRAHIVNLDYVKQLVPFDGSRMQVEMRDGTKILASRTRSKELRQLAI